MSAVEDAAMDKVFAHEHTVDDHAYEVVNESMRESLSNLVQSIHTGTATDEFLQRLETGGLALLPSEELQRLRSAEWTDAVTKAASERMCNALGVQSPLTADELADEVEARVAGRPPIFPVRS